MAAPKKVYRMQWMNRTRYKDEKGKLIIKRTPEYKTESAIMAEYDRVTKLGYACRVMVAELELMDCINFSNNCKTEKRYVERNRSVFIENDRWKLRMKEDEIRHLTAQKENAIKHLKEIDEKLKKLQEE